MKNRKSVIAILVASLMAAGILGGCQNGGAAVSSAQPTAPASSAAESANKLSGDITADGSTALQPLLSNFAAPMFKQKYSDTFSGSVTVNGGGSGTGLSDVESGSVLVGDSDVTVEQAGKNFSDLVDHPICTVAVALVVSPDVAEKFGSKAISIDSVQKIYSGKITNWKDVPGSGNYNKPIMVCYRKKGSGTRTLFETFGTKAKFDDNASYVKNSDAFVFTNASADLQTKINGFEGAIGYETMPYAKDMKKLSIDFGNGAVPCDYDHVNDGSYQIWGYEHLYTKGEPNATVKTFIDYITSEDFKSIVQSNGYGISSDVSEKAAASHK